MSNRVVPQLVMDRVRKVLTAGHGVCRVRVTVLGGVSLQLLPGEAVAITGALPLARSMLCAIAAGVARADAGRVRWSERGIAGVRYAPAGDAPRALLRRDGLPAGLIVLDAALVESAPAPDVRALVELLKPWLASGGAALVAAPVAAALWPWRILELAGGQLRAVQSAPVPTIAPAWPGGLRRVAERAAVPTEHLLPARVAHRVAQAHPDQ
jgi:hypothetical protein